MLEKLYVSGCGGLSQALSNFPEEKHSFSFQGCGNVVATIFYSIWQIVQSLWELIYLFINHILL